MRLCQSLTELNALKNIPVFFLKGLFIIFHNVKIWIFDDESLYRLSNQKFTVWPRDRLILFGDDFDKAVYQVSANCACIYSLGDALWYEKKVFFHIFWESGNSKLDVKPEVDGKISTKSILCSILCRPAIIHLSILLKSFFVKFLTILSSFTLSSKSFIMKKCCFFSFFGIGPQKTGCKIENSHVYGPADVCKLTGGLLGA